jgi:hypothetical protein
MIGRQMMNVGSEAQAIVIIIGLASSTRNPPQTVGPLLTASKLIKSGIEEAVR